MQLPKSSQEYIFIYKQDWQWAGQFLLPLSGGWMEARVLGCPGRPMAMLALSDARRVAREG